jgi:hypothetical protein
MVVAEKVLIQCRVTSTYMFPYKEDLFRFDFEVDSEDEYTCQGVDNALLKGLITPPLAQEERN